jgi:hypothetical protein
VQGRLREEPLTFSIATECAHCARPIHIEMDGRLGYRVVESDAEPLVFTPIVDFKNLSGPSIIDDF